MCANWGLSRCTSLARRLLHTTRVVAHDNPLGLPRPQGMPQARPRRDPVAGLPRRMPIAGVEHVIAVASGKGGVGKSTVAVNLAVALAQQHKSVGILDVDLFGPSVPRMMGVSGAPEINSRGQMLPLRRHGVQVMSMGLLVPDGSAVVWRGLMVMKALEQLLRQVFWDNLDVLVLDMPPGTGDAQLTITQQIPLAGAVIVSTPQEVALGAVRKGADMFGKVNVPVIGVVDNMSYFVCTHCTERTYPFGTDTVGRLAETLKVPLLGRLPIEPAVSSTSDSGTPIVVSNGDSPSAKEFTSIAAKTAEFIRQLPKKTN